MFEIYVFISVIFGFLTLLFSISAVVSVIREGASKSTILSALATALSAGFAIISYCNINIPAPVILPLNNKTEIYNDNLEITIE